MTLETDLTEVILSHYSDDGFSGRARELMRRPYTLAPRPPATQSPIRCAMCTLARELRADFESDAYARFPSDGLWRSVAMLLIDNIPWPAIAATLLAAAADEIDGFPNHWYTALSHGQRAILAWADNTGSLYDEKVKLEAETREHGICDGWIKWIQRAYEDYRRVSHSDPDSVILNFTARLELAHFCEARAVCSAPPNPEDNYDDT